MALYDFPNVTSGFDVALTETQGIVNIFVPMFLMFVFFVVLIGGAMKQKARTTSADMPFWTALASLSTMLIALPMTLVSGLIQTETLAIVTAIAILSGFWYFFDRNKNEI